MADRIRTTVSIDPEVLEIFRVMADAGGLSVSRCIGEWLADTAEGAQLVATKMVEARRAPGRVMREMQAASRGLVEEIDRAASDLRHARGGLRPDGGTAAGRSSAPSSNTGLKSPGTRSKRKP